MTSTQHTSILATSNNQTIETLHFEIALLLNLNITQWEKALNTVIPTTSLEDIEEQWENMNLLEQQTITILQFILQHHQVTRKQKKQLQTHIKNISCFSTSQPDE